jgi:hypothetical protein
MSTLFLICVMHCCTKVMAPDSNWVDRDYQALHGAQNNCKQEYKESPCLVEFKRVEENVYRALCGKENN